MKFMEEQASCDAVLVQVLSAPRPQHRCAHVLEIFSAQYGIGLQMAGANLTFVHAPSTWGNRPIQPGETALIFLRAINDKLYECSWNGHFAIEVHDGERFIVYDFPELWLHKEVPLALRDCARPHPQSPQVSLVPLDALLEYLRHLQGAKTAAPR